MKLRKTLRILSAALSLLIILSMLTSCGIVNLIANSIVTSASTSANKVDFNTLEYERPDFFAIRAGFESLIQKVKEQPSYIILNFLASKTLMAYQDAMTMFSLVQIRFYANVNDTEAEEEINYCTAEFSKMDPLVNEFYASLIEYGYKDTLLYGMSETDFEYIELRKKLFDEEYEALTTERTKLENQYMALPSQITVYSEGGKDYTIAECKELYGTGEMSMDDYRAAVNRYYSELAKSSFPIYMRMIEIDNTLAQKVGYDSYADYSYRYVYSRDYAPSETVGISDTVQGKIVPLYQKVMNAIDKDIVADILSREDHTLDAYDSIISEYAQEISGDMYRAYKDLKKYNLSIIGSDDGMQQAGFTTYLYTYEMPFMYIYTYGDIDDINTFVHEFGHFYAFHYNTYESDNIIDISEIQSQTSEWLFLPYYDLTEEELAQYTLYRLSSTLSNIIEGCLYDEFQRAVYENANELKTADDLNALFKDIADHYQYESMYQSYDISTLWAGIHHNFTAPFYYVSYAVSALSALEIYSISLEDRAEAIDIYNAICDDFGNNEYSDKLKDCSLSNPLDKNETFDYITEIIDKAIKKAQAVPSTDQKAA